MARPVDFYHSQQEEPHKARTRAILKQHPEVRSLIGHTPGTFVIILAVVAFQTAMALLVHDQAWWVALAAAYLFGAFANHMCYVLIHEATHNLIFKRRTSNILAGMIADLPNVLPASVSFRSYHMKHHSYQGNYYLDADLASYWEAKLIGNTPVGKAMWLLLFPFFQALRPPRLRGIPFITGWTVVNWVIGLAFDAAIFVFLGPTALLYLVASFFFAIGLHPLGARWIQEHYLVEPPQETYSYYGPANIVALNVGYHNEHHDFPSIPWSRLPKLKAAAPGFYDTLIWHKSWTRLLMRFLFSSKLSLFSRMLRTS